jgi:hypothetical protein
MEPIAKRTRSSLNTCNDPFDKLWDVHHLIYQHLNGEDVKQASLVSKQWYEEIGMSRVCMQKIQLKFRNSEIETTVSNETVFEGHRVINPKAKLTEREISAILDSRGVARNLMRGVTAHTTHCI